MLNAEQLKLIPRTTKLYWDSLNLEDTFGHEWVENYMDQFHEVKEVYQKKFAFRSIRLLANVHELFFEFMDSIKQKKKFIKKNKALLLDKIETLQKNKLVSLERACKLFHVTTAWYRKQKSKLFCKISPLNSCFTQQPNQLAIDEVEAIEKLVTHPKNKRFNQTTLYYKALNNRIVVCGKSTFAKYASIFKTFRKNKFNAKPKEGFRAEKVFEYLHVDITLVPTTDSGVQRLAFVKDNFSKAILHYKSTPLSGTSDFIKDLLKETFEIHGLLEKNESIHIVTDGGPENQGLVNKWIESIKAPPIVKKITAKTYEFPYSNSMAESTHSILKTEFLNKTTPYNSDEYNKLIKEFVHYYNHLRYPGELHGYTPHQVLEGEIPTKNRYEEIIKTAQKERIEKNKQLNNCYKGLCHA